MLGVDVSHHNGIIIWDLLKKNIDFAIIRCGYGQNITQQDDRRWAYNVSECERLLIPYGVYLYCYADSEKRIDGEIQHMERLLENHNPVCGVWLDLEENGTEHLFSSHAEAFYNHFKDRYITGIYANKSDMENYLRDIPSGCHRWVAQWNSECTYKENWTIWQHSSDGKLDGCKTRIDLNYAEKFWSSRQQSLQDVANDVIKGLYGNGEERKRRIPAETAFSYTEVQSLVNEMLKEKNSFYNVPETETKSIVDALKSIGVDSSYVYRKQIALSNGIDNYKGTAKQNLKMIELLYSGKLRKI